MMAITNDVCNEQRSPRSAYDMDAVLANREDVAVDAALAILRSRASRRVAFYLDAALRAPTNGFANIVLTNEPQPPTD